MVINMAVQRTQVCAAAHIEGRLTKTRHHDNSL